MSKLSVALEARDKATPGPWDTWQTERDGCGYLSIGPKSMEPGTNAEIVCDITSILTMNEKDKANAKQIKATPDALDWIAQALPFLRLSKHVHIPETRPELIDDPWDDALTALIAQAEGQKEGENE